ncbi:2Fe-2S iron-sulfur cluster-binding protein [Spelaeicoccus albus]|uniref:2Fe-2S iron-sulfur cluster-binding protein n=1 Tax=Spelaeicoccus albus TaxID=1280376 RepID=UPI0015CE3FCB|nr:2Fe-2S iron-sulfur cluster-binding protein [Spelaeicoccus albus]
MRAVSRRLPDGGRIDRTVTYELTVDGVAVTAHPGDTVASALLASGRTCVGTSLYRHRPRGIVTAGIEEPNALIRIRTAGSVAESMLPATVVPAADGLEVETLTGRGRLDPDPDSDLYDKKFVHTDVLVIGGGPAGLAAAAEAAATDARVILLDEQAELGGSLLSGGDSIDGLPAADWVDGVRRDLSSHPETTVLPRTTAFGSYDGNFVLALEDRSAEADRHGARAAGVSRQRVWHIRAQQIVIATGAHERPLVFANNDRPGVMLASAARSYVGRYGVAVGDRVVVATTNDSAYATVSVLRDAGIDVAAVADSRETLSDAAAAAQDADVRVLTGTAVVDTVAAPDGTGRVAGAVLGSLSLDEPGETEAVDCDTVAVSGGWSPVVHLHSQRQGALTWNDRLCSFVPDTAVDDQQVIGAARGDYRFADILGSARAAGAAAAARAGWGDAAEPTLGAPRGDGVTRPLWLVANPADPNQWDNHFIDLQRDSTVSDVLRATGAGLRSVELVKRYTTLSTASDQGKTSAVNAIGVIAGILAGGEGADVGMGDVGTTTFRAPYAPVAFAALAGRERGELFDPARLTSIHEWHVEHGAVFEDVGQWKRPRYYPQDGEDMDAAVNRECLAARNNVAFQDVTTLGKIEIWGKDAAEFLGRIYTNGFKKLVPGKGRYGIMCTADGMIFDDGVSLRIADDRYFMTTTTGGAARVLDWLEEWLQTEWPELDVHCTSVTEQWTAIAVVGPRSREVVAKVAPELDVSQDAFKFMEFRTTTLASGVPARICRISFNGELSFEINVAGWYGRSVWEDVAEAGAEFDITPYGTESMHVMRAEKGLIIAGQDTDGTVTPYDAGMGWIVSKLKDFVGKRSFSRADQERTGRKQLVGLFPADKSFRLPEGAQLVERGTPITPEEGPVPMIGHVTSSYFSSNLGRSFALALIKDGHHRLGDIVTAPVNGVLMDVEITDSVFYDKEGTKRDG